MNPKREGAYLIYDCRKEHDFDPQDLDDCDAFVTWVLNDPKRAFGWLEFNRYHGTLNDLDAIEVALWVGM